MLAPDSGAGRRTDHRRARARRRRSPSSSTKTLAGRVPPAVSAEELRALLEVATVIRAASGGLPLAPSRQRSIVEDALRQAVGEPSASMDIVPISGRAPGAGCRGRSPVRRRSSRRPRSRCSRCATLEGTPSPQAATASIPASWKSRPSDALIGPIAREHAGDAAARLDYIFADRLDAYRERRCWSQAVKYLLLFVALAACSQDAPPPSVTKVADPGDVIDQDLMVAPRRGEEFPPQGEALHERWQGGRRDRRDPPDPRAPLPGKRARGR